MKKTKPLQIFILAVLILISQSACFQNDSSLDELIKNYMAENRVPGLACAVINTGGISWSKAYGLADVENGIPMSVDGIMNIASISKTITATAVMQLWENGQIALEEDINMYLPAPLRNPHFPDIPITIKQHQYSNVGYGLLGYIVEEVSDMPFYSYCKKHIFGPLKMEKSGWFLNEIDIPNHILPHFFVTDETKEYLSKNYGTFFPDETDFAAGKYVAPCLYSFPNYPDGLLRTSVVDLSNFLTAYINSGKYDKTSLLKPSSVNKMLSLQIEDHPSQGLCWHKSDFESMWGHGGGDPGVQTKMYFNPETKIGIIIFQNSSPGDQWEILKKLYIKP